MTDASEGQLQQAAALARGALGHAPAGLLTDLDGTLAPIVCDPYAARPLPAAVEALHALRSRLAVAAVITGRAAQDARRMLGGDELLVIGNHGVEWLEPGERTPVPRHELSWAPAAVHQLVAGLDLGSDVWVEDKGVSATLHFRNAPDPEATRARLSAALDGLSDTRLVVRPGRKSLEIRPAAAGDKGTALQAVISRYGLRGVLVLGDDVTDLDMFRVAAEARAAGRAEAAIFAVAGAGEVPPAIAAAADLVLPDPAAAAELLSWLAADAA
ncbi:MAG TPA: trehalose-phosphatase [Candidatus Limnocylindria bacterium]